MILLHQDLHRVVAFLLLWTPLTFAEDNSALSPETCLQNLLELESQSLSELKKIEQHYLFMNWELKKWREILYKPLWEARIQMSESYSPNRQSEGQVLYSRYEALAESSWNQAEEESHLMNQGLRKFETQLESINKACPSISYQNCLALWDDKVGQFLNELTKTIRLIEKAEADLNKKMLSTLAENPSEHDELGRRIIEVRQKWEESYEPELMRLLRQLEEQVRYLLPAESCSQLCTEKEVSQTKPSWRSPESQSPSLDETAEKTPILGERLSEPAVNPNKKNKLLV